MREDHVMGMSQSVTQSHYEPPNDICLYQLHPPSGWQFQIVDTMRQYFPPLLVRLLNNCDMALEANQHEPTENRPVAFGWGRLAGHGSGLASCWHSEWTWTELDRAG